MFSRILQTIFLSIAPLFLVLVLIINALTNFSSHKEFLLKNQIYSKLEISFQKTTNQNFLKAKDMQILAETNLDNVQKWLETNGALPKTKCGELNNLVQTNLKDQLNKNLAPNFSSQIQNAASGVCVNELVFNPSESDAYIRGIYQRVKSSQTAIFGFIAMLFLGICVLAIVEGRNLFGTMSGVLTAFAFAMFSSAFGFFMLLGGSLYVFNFTKNTLLPDNFTKEIGDLISQNALNFSWQIVSISIFTAIVIFGIGKILNFFK